jgi:hypothetical protein
MGQIVSVVFEAILVAVRHFRVYIHKGRQRNISRLNLTNCETAVKANTYDILVG